MAPVAAALADGMALDMVGPQIEVGTCVLLDLPEPHFDEHGITGQVLYIDNFGNIRTTITTSHLSHYQPASFAGIYIGGNQINAISSTYSDQPEGEFVATIDSAGYLEVAVNRGMPCKKPIAARATRLPSS